MDLKNKFEDYSEEEFEVFVADIFKENTSADDEVLEQLLDHFEKITGHPDGSDFIYYTIADKYCNPNGVTKAIKNWRKSQGLPLFKDSK